MLTRRSGQSQERRGRLSRPASLAEIELPSGQREERMQGFMDTAKALSKPLMPQTELEQSALKVTLANAGFRSDSAMSVYLGIRFATFIAFSVIGLSIFVPRYGINFGGLKWVIGMA